MSDYIRRYLSAAPTAEACLQIENAVREEALLCPEKPLYPGAVELIMEPDGDELRQGQCLLRYERNEAFSRLARDMKMSFDPTMGAYLRRIDEYAGPLPERCAEIGSRLLLAGFRILIMDEAVRTMICTGSFGWEYGRWILPGESPARLRLVFPHDQALFQRARTLGAFWTGQQIEIGVWHAEDLMEFARLYEFRISSEARIQMDSWREMYLQGKAVRPGKPPEDGWQRGDPVREILESDPPIPEDLIDED